MTDFESAREKYKPARIEYLLVAEAPPTAESKRFFYFENIQNGDSLFLETMKVLYPCDCSDIKIIRQQKGEFLERFQRDGFYLIDATNTPMKGFTQSEKKREIKNSIDPLIKKIESLVSQQTKVILISSIVYDVCRDRLITEGFDIINDSMIPFPIRWQIEFRERLASLLRRCGWRTT
jgi:hypothetical protein